MWLLALLSCVGLMICGTSAQGAPPNGDEIQLTTHPVVTAAAASLFSGAGTETNPYKITSGADMIALSTTTDYSAYWGTSSKTVYYKLTKDITVTADTWTPIGNGTNKFYGVFDGCGKTITIQVQSGSDITINTVDTGNIQYVGLFGCADENRSLIANVIVSYECDIKVQQTGNNGGRTIYVGLLGGYLPSFYNVSILGRMIDCTGGNAYNDKVNMVVVGGVAGYGGGCADKGNVLCNSYAEVYVNIRALSVSNACIGGIVGKMEPTSSNTLTIQNCGVGVLQYSWSGSTVSIVDNIGGIVGDAGDASTKITVSNCFVDSLNANDPNGIIGYAGGIIGECNLQSGSSFKHCYVSGQMTLVADDGVYKGKLGTIAAANNSDATGITIEDCLYELTLDDSGSGKFLDMGSDVSDSGESIIFTDLSWVSEHFTSANGWSEDIWGRELDPDDDTYCLLFLNVAGIYRVEHPVVGTGFTVIFNNDTPKGGLFLYVLRLNDSGGYSEIRQYYFEGVNETETIYYELTQGANYKVLISKPYVWEFTIEGTTDLSGTAANGQFTFTAPAPDVGGTVTIEASGGTPPNNFAVV